MEPRWGAHNSLSRVLVRPGYDSLVSTLLSASQILASWTFNCGGSRTFCSSVLIPWFTIREVEVDVEIVSSGRALLRPRGLPSPVYTAYALIFAHVVVPF